MAISECPVHPDLRATWKQEEGLCGLGLVTWPSLVSLRAVINKKEGDGANLQGCEGQSHDICERG